MKPTIEALSGPPADEQPIEVVERKGLGHPDTICDALAEGLSLALSRFYRERFGAVLHHNVDKALLWGGRSRPAYGGGEVLAPVEIYLAGRATAEWRGVRVPIEELAVEGSRSWIDVHLPHLDARQHVRIHPLVRPGSAELVDLYLRAREGEAPPANDTSCGVGWAPLSRLEAVVLHVERTLNSAPAKASHPEIGEDVKVMGVRRGEAIELTVACALVGRHVSKLEDYLEKRARIAALVQESALALAGGEVRVSVNAADDPARESVYLTVTGTSAESGDDGEAGRGNRVNGLIAPGRPMTLESAAGKNPVTHVGKLYNLAAGLIAQELVDRVAGIEEAHCWFVSRIGSPIDRPQIAHVRLRDAEGRPPGIHADAVEAIVRDRLGRLHEIAADLLDGRLALDRWPLRSEA
jgi:S-adenosylmethionine synthetase